MDDFIDDEVEDDEDYSEEEGGGRKDYSQMVREIFKYNPSKYADADADIDNMETDFHSQLKEEKQR